MTKYTSKRVLYVKPNEFISGVPTRTMDVTEFEELSPELQALALQSGVYIYENNPKDVDEKATQEA